MALCECTKSCPAPRRLRAVDDGLVLASKFKLDSSAAFWADTVEIVSWISALSESVGGIFDVKRWGTGETNSTLGVAVTGELMPPRDKDNLESLSRRVLELLLAALSVLLLLLPTPLEE